MKTKQRMFFLLLLAGISYAKMPNTAVSPFVVRGFSYTFTISNFKIYDKNFGDRNNYGDWQETQELNRERLIFDSRMLYENSWAANDFFSVGIKNRAEIEFMLALPFTVNSQVKVNVFSRTNTRDAFRNIAISPFVGQFFQRNIHDYNDIYGGISIGTRQSAANNRFLLEFYSSPMIYSSKLTILANNNNPEYYGKADFLTLNTPIGTRMLIGRTRKFSWDLGVTPVIHLKDTWIKTNTAAFFMKTSFHLGRKR